MTTSTQWLLAMTDVGRAAIQSADGQGMQTKIAAVAVGTGRYLVRDAQGNATEIALQATALQHERLRVPIHAGGATARGSLQILAELSRATSLAEEFYISEVGFLDEDGVLLSVWSDPTASLGYRGSLNPWVLNLGWTFSDMPAHAITVDVVSAPLSGMLISVSQLKAQLQAMAEQSGLPYAPDNPDALAAAISAQVEAAMASANKAVRQPIGVSPANGTVATLLIPTLTGSNFFSADGYAHQSSQFIVKRTDGTTVHDSGEVAAALTHQVPTGKLAITTTYDWQVRYKGVLGGTTFWSDWSVTSRFSTAATIVVAPALLSPANGTTNVGAQPTLTTSAFSVNNGSDVHSKTRWQIATNAGFTTIIYDSGDSGSLTQLVVPANTLQANTTYYVRARHVGAVLGASGWSDAILFSTRPSFVYVAPPTVQAPTNGQQGVSLTPTFTFSAYSVIGGSDTHQSTQVQVRLASGDWSSTIYDSGEVAATTSITPALASALPADTNCVTRARYRGAATGWSAWSADVAFRTKIPSGNILFTAVGQQIFTVPAGVYEVDAEPTGGGGGGGYYTGGGGGGYAKKRIPVVPGQQIPVTVAAGGVNGTTGVNTSTPGGTSSFGSYVSATGGQPGSWAGATHSLGGTGVNGDVNYTGGKGGNYVPDEAGAQLSAGAAGGGGAAGRSGNGFDGENAQNDYSTGGLGGNGNGPHAGKGGKGKGGHYGASPATPGLQYGGGGAGGASDGSQSGSVGSSGCVYVSW